jgi:4-hydroxy-3-polyprenylbenzoate decarboxylase
MRRIVIGISGASGAIYGVRLLQVLRAQPEIETHVVMSKAALLTIAHETPFDPEAVTALADRVYDQGDIGASIASGSFRTEGMVIAPCSMKTLSAVASSYTDNLMSRAADVCLKERRKLVLVVRETPLHLGHLRLMTAVTEMGAVVLPPVPAFYARPRTVEAIVDHTVGKVLDQFGVEANVMDRWSGLSAEVGVDRLEEPDGPANS